MFGPEVRDILTAANLTTITIGAGATVYTKSFSLKFGAYFALAYKAASAGAVDLTIQLEQSYQKPTTEGVADSTYVIPESLADIHTNLADENWHNNSISPAAMPYGRLKIVSAAGVENTLQAKLSVQESM